MGIGLSDCRRLLECVAGFWRELASKDLSVLSKICRNRWVYDFGLLTEVQKITPRSGTDVLR